MTIDYTITHTAEKDNDIADAISRMYKYSGVSTTEDDLIPHSVDSTTFRPLQDITSNHIYRSAQSTTSSLGSDNSYHNMSPCRSINLTHVDYDINKSRGRAETTGHYHSCPHLDVEDMELCSEDDYEVSKKKDKEVFSDEEPLSPTPEELFEKYKASSTNNNLRPYYHSVSQQVVLSR